MLNQETWGNRHFDPKTAPKPAPETDPGSGLPATAIDRLIPGYRLCARTEGKSPQTIAIVTHSVTYMRRFLDSAGLSTDVRLIGRDEFRAYIIHLQERKCFAYHPRNPPLDRALSGHSISVYLRSIKSFWSWLAAEGILPRNPLHDVKIPKAPRKVIRTFTDAQLQQLLGAIHLSRPLGCRDQAIILTLLDTALRVSELAGIQMDDVGLEEGLIRVMGKGARERIVPFGGAVQRILWRYMTLSRPEPVAPGSDHLFLTHDGRPVNKDCVDRILKRHAARADIRGVRCSPHTLRHTAAVSFLRNGGNAFTLQRLLGHASLEMTKHYCEINDSDVKAAHRAASPADNFVLKSDAAAVRSLPPALPRHASQPDVIYE